jgi:hypothetical protein
MTGLTDHAILTRVRNLLAGMQARAGQLDRDAQYPADDILALHRAGALTAVLPAGSGGLGLGTEPDGAECLSQLLQMLGYSHLAVARLFEAHVNAIRLVARYGAPCQLHRVAGDVAAGHLIGLWVTDAPHNPLSASLEGLLHGGKAFCSGAGHVERALVTCRHPDETTRLAYLDTDRARATPLPAALQGLRAAATGMVGFDGATIAASDWIGEPGDYLREPDFSAGAWRTSAATAGCLARLVDLAIEHLAERDRAGNAHQQTRIGRAWIARETARLWTRVAASAAEAAPPVDAPAAVASVNFARIAIEASSVEALNLVERSVGLQAFLTGSDIERVRRDLATYLRQPAPDEVLAEAAAYVVQTRSGEP